MSKKILLADDSITIQKVIELTFSDVDFDVVTVGNGRLALEKLAQAGPRPRAPAGRAGPRRLNPRLSRRHRPYRPGWWSEPPPLRFSSRSRRRGRSRLPCHRCPPPLRAPPRASSRTTTSLRPS